MSGPIEPLLELVTLFNIVLDPLLKLAVLELIEAAPILTLVKLLLLPIINEFDSEKPPEREVRGCERAFAAEPPWYFTSCFITELVVPSAVRPVEVTWIVSLSPTKANWTVARPPPGMVTSC